MIGTEEIHGSLQPILEVVSVVAEVLAFFLVTTDLYGEQRLEALQKRLSSFSLLAVLKLRVFDFDEEPDVFSLGSPVGFVIRCLLLIGIYFLIPSVMAQLAGQPPLIVQIADTGLLAFLGITMVCGLILIPIDIIRLIPRAALWLIRRAGMKHLLLGIGALLFLFSKSLLIFTLVHDFSRPLALW